MILHVPEGQWADAVTALAESHEVTTPVQVVKAAASLRAALHELGLEVTVTTDKPQHRVVS